MREKRILYRSLCSEEDANDEERVVAALGRVMHDVQFQLAILAADRMLRRRVQMKLTERMNFAVRSQPNAPTVFGLHFDFEVEALEKEVIQPDILVTQVKRL